MRTISAQSITDTVARLCIKANTQLPQDVQAALEKAREEEPWPLAKNTLDLLWSNLGAAKEKDLPICQDTGMACVFIELGQDAHISGDLTDAVDEALPVTCGDRDDDLAKTRCLRRRVGGRDVSHALIPPCRARTAPMRCRSATLPEM